MIWPLSILRRDLLKTLTGSERMGDMPGWVAEVELGDDFGYLPPEGAAWKVHSHVATIIGGIRALLMQALHPGAMAGVSEHSQYRTDPLARLNGTIRWMMTVTYADTAGADRVCAYVRRLHQPVVGTYRGPQGEEQHYSANNPDLALWVHTAFADSFLAVHQAYGESVDLKRPNFADRYLSEWAIAGTLMGAEHPPRTRAEMDAYIAGLTEQGVLRCDDRTREVLNFLRKPPLAPSLGLGYQLLFRAAVATLRPEHQRILGLELRGAWVFRLVTKPFLKAIRWLLGSENSSLINARRRHARLNAAGKAPGTSPQRRPEEQVEVRGTQG